MLPVSPDCPFWVCPFGILCCVSCTQCCLYHQIVHSWFAPLIFSVVCLVLNVACITRLSILGLPLWYSLLCVLYPMLPVSPDCPFWVCPFDFLCCVSCTLYHQIVHGFAMLPVSPDCPFWVCPFDFLCCVSCTQCCLYHQIVHSGFAPLIFSVVCLVPIVACITRLSILGLPLWFSLLCVLYSMLPVSPDCPFWVCPFDFLCCVSCTQCCLYHQIVHSGFAPLIFSVVCLVLNVACITRLSILGLPLWFSLLCVLYPMLPVSPDCPFWVCPFDFLCCVSCTQCCLYHQIVHSGFAPLVFSVVCLVPNVACITRLSILGLSLWYSLLCVLYPMLPVSPDCPFWVCPFDFLCCVSCTQCCLYHQIVHSGFAPLIFSVVCLLPNVACITGLSILGLPLWFSLLCVLYPMLPVSPYCPFWVCPFDFLCCVSCTQCCLYHQIVHSGFAPLIFSVVCLVPNVACITRLSILGLPLWFSLLCVLYSMLPVSPDCPFWVCPFDFLCCVSCTQCCLYHQIVHSGFAPLIFSVVCLVSNVACITRLSILGLPLWFSLLCVLYSMLPVSPDCPFLVCPFDFLCCVSCTQCCLYHQIVHSGFAPLIFSVVCLVLNVACITRLSILGLSLWLSLLCVLYPMLPVSPDCPFWVFPFSFL